MSKTGMNLVRKGCRMVQILSPKNTLILLLINPYCQSLSRYKCHSGMKFVCLFFHLPKGRVNEQDGL